MLVSQKTQNARGDVCWLGTDGAVGSMGKSAVVVLVDGKHRETEGREVCEVPNREEKLQKNGVTCANGGCENTEGLQVYLGNVLVSAEKKSTHWLGWVGYVERRMLKRVCVRGQFVWEKREGDFGRGRGKRLLVFYYGRLIE